MNCVRFILVVFSLILYWIAPLEYSQTFSILCLSIFAISAFQIIRFDVKQVGFFGFNTVFMVSFFLCSFAFPVFMLPAGESGYLYEKTVIGLSVDTINKTTALNTVAIAVYAYAYLLFKRVSKDGLSVPSTSCCKLIKWLFRLTALLALGTALLFANSSDSVAVTNNPFLFVLLYCILAIYTIIVFRVARNEGLSVNHIILNNAIDFGIILLFCLVFMVIGDRGPLIKVSLILLSSFSFFYKRFSFKTLISISVVGVLLLFVIGISRGGDYSIREAGISGVMEAMQTSIISNNNANLWLVLRDLTGRYIEINAGYKYVMDNGFLYPWKIIPILFAPLPLIPSLLSQLLEGVSFKGLSSVNAINSSLFAGQYGWMGTQCVIDVYMSWGLVGVLLIYATLGFLFSSITRNYRKNLNHSAVYVVLMASSLYLPRAVFYDFYRPIVWTIVLVHIITKYGKRTVKHY